MHNYTIETDRLILRPLKIEDAQAVYQWVSDERVAKYMVYNTYTSLEEAVEWLTMLQEPDEEYHFGFVRKEDGLLIGSGSIGPESERKDFWAFGYNFRYDCWGKGYATEAAKAMIKFANEKFGAMKFSSSHAEPNKASGKVMEKCGLHFTAYGEFQKLDGTGKMSSLEYEMENYNDKFQYKKATIVDIDELVKIRIIVLRAANKLSDDVDMSTVEKESYAYYKLALENGEHIAYLVYDNGTFIGAGGVSFYQVMPTYHNPTGKKAYIMNMYTVPEYRRQGIAIHTLDLLVKDAREHGVSQINLEATEMGRPLYEKYGFVKMEDEMELI